MGNFCYWWKYWRCTVGGWFLALFYSEGIQFVYLDTAKWSKLEGSRDYEEVQFKVSLPIWGKVLHSLMSKKDREKCPHLLSVLEMPSASHFLILVLQLQLQLPVLLGSCMGEIKDFYWDDVRTGLKDKSYSAATWLKSRDHPVGHCLHLVKGAVCIMAQATAWPVIAALLRWASWESLQTLWL